MEYLRYYQNLDQTTQIVISFAAGVLMIYPAWLILKRAGINPLFSLVLAIPVLGYLFLISILAFSTWPTEPEGYR
jgi:hypothetical protein